MPARTFHSTLAVPMITGNKVIGVLNLESVEADFFTMEQASFIKSLAGHAAISIDNANLLVERERQINILTLLRELSLDALSVIHPEDIVDAVLRTALILLEGDETAIYRYNKQTHQLMFSGGVRSDQGQIVTAQPIIPQTILEEAIQKMTLQFVPDIHQSQHYLFRVDPSIARGLDYYTGTVFETFLDDLPGIGSCCSGGRYDDLAGLYSKESLPGVGASLGVDRLLAAMEELGMVEGSSAPCAAFVPMLEKGPGRRLSGARRRDSAGRRRCRTVPPSRASSALSSSTRRAVGSATP